VLGFTGTLIIHNTTGMNHLKEQTLACCTHNMQCLLSLNAT